jgi:hypothetical protein
MPKSGKEHYGDIIHFEKIGGDGKKNVPFDKCKKCQKKILGRSSCFKKHCPGGKSNVTVKLKF